MIETEKMSDNPYLADQLKHMQSPVLIDALDAKLNKAEEFLILDADKKSNEVIDLDDVIDDEDDDINNG